MNKPHAIIMDLDGTLADSSHRVHHIINPEGKVDWDSWNALVHLDTPNHWCVKLIKALDQAGVHIIFLTGRNETIRGPTVKWLRNILGDDIVDKSPLLMRGILDRRKGPVIKMEFYRNVIEPNYDVLFAVDDTASIADAFREAGLTVLHCDDEGDDRGSANWNESEDKK